MDGVCFQSETTLKVRKQGDTNFKQFVKAKICSSVERILEPCHPEERSDVGIALSSNINLTPHLSFGNPLLYRARNKKQKLFL